MVFAAISIRKDFAFSRVRVKRVLTGGGGWIMR